MTPKSTLEKVSQERIQKVIELYQQGLPASKIISVVNMTTRTVKTIIERYGIKLNRADLIQKGKNNSKVNHKILDELTPDALYWIGFLYADGHIEKDRPRITLTISSEDENHLIKFKNFFGENLSIRDVTSKKTNTSLRGRITFDSKYYRVAFSSLRIYERLKELGFNHNKTYYIIPDKNLKNSRDFWRGVIDGDGSFSFSDDYKSISLSGTKNTCEEFLNFVNSLEKLTESKVYKDNRAEVYKATIHSLKVPKILNILYKDSTTYLDRKYKKYLELIKKP